MPEYMEINNLRDEYVICRAIGHSWDENPNGEVDSELFRMGAGAICLRCTRCTTERFDYIGLDMSVIYRYYRYPDKYTTIPGEGSRPNLRGEMFSRSLLVKKYTGRRRG